MSQVQNKSGIPFIDIQPIETIEFKYIEGKNLISVINIENRSQAHVAYKIKTTNPKNYVVKPNQGILAPNEKLIVDIQLQHYVNSNKLQFNKDKFLIQAAQLMDSNPRQENFQQYWQEIPQNTIPQHKLQVLLTSNNDSQQQQYNTPQKNESQGQGVNQDIFKSQIPDHSQQMQSTASFNQYVQASQSKMSQNFQQSQLPVEGFAGQNKSNENQQKFEDILSKVQQQEKLLMSLSEERNNYQTELEQYKNIANSKQQNYKDESSGFQFWHLILVAIFSIVIGAFLSFR